MHIQIDVDHGNIAGPGGTRKVPRMRDGAVILIKIANILLKRNTSIGRYQQLEANVDLMSGIYI